jgi:4-azaleucine resistance transporter AzlC
MRLRQFWLGVRDELPLMLGVVPFGLIFGVVANAAHLPTLTSAAMSPIIFAGSSQLIFARLYGDGAPLLTIILTAAILNLRHVLYSASIAPYLQTFSRAWKTVLAYLLTDEAYAIVISHFERSGDPASFARQFKQWYFLGAGLTLWITWQLSTVLGVLVGGQIPESWGLDFSVPLTFIAIVVPALRDRSSAIAMLVSGALAVLLIAMPLRLNLVVASLAGVAVGLLIDQRRRA